MRKQWKPGPFLLAVSGLGTRLLQYILHQYTDVADVLQYILHQYTDAADVLQYILHQYTDVADVLQYADAVQFLWIWLNHLSHRNVCI